MGQISAYMLRETTVSVDLRKSLRTPSDVVALLRVFYVAQRTTDREVFVAVYTDTKHKPIHIGVVAVGSLNATAVHPREIFKTACEYSAAAVFLAHNHPSGDSTPSREDVEFTRRMVQAGRIIGIEVLDHIVLGDGHISMSESGLM